MSHTVCSLEHIRRDSYELKQAKKLKQPEDSVEYVADTNENNVRNGAKFGVELKRTNSQTSQGRRKSSCSEIPHVEEIFDLELLEKMLETVVGYEQRRRIRSQIRVARKLNTNNEISQSNLTKKQTDLKLNQTRTYDSSPSRTQTKKSPYVETIFINSKTENNKTSSRNIESRKSRSPSPRTHKQFEQPSNTENIRNTINISKQSQSTNYENRRKLSRSPSPKLHSIVQDERPTTEIETYTSKSVSRNVIVSTNKDDEKPIWATRNILKKVSESPVRSFKSGTSKTKTVTKVQKQKTIESSIEDCVTSSYGIGPTDEDGKPLFGIRALKKKSQPNSQSANKGRPLFVVVIRFQEFIYIKILSYFSNRHNCTRNTIQSK